MIELPEANVLAQQINQTLPGKEIATAQANQSPHKFAWYSGDPANYARILPGNTITGAASVGNHVEIHAGELTLAISTPIKYHAAGNKLPPKHQLLLKFQDESVLTCTVQMWGALLCLQPDEQPNLIDHRAAHQKPSPLSEAFDRAYFDSLFNEGSGSLSAKAFLATEQRIPGLGNGVLQDILWTARIHPRRKLADLQPDELGAMFEAVKGVLREMVECGGRDTERDLFDHPGGYRTILSKLTVNTPCPACGSRIQKEAYLGGSVYYCPDCQSLS